MSRHKYPDLDKFLAAWMARQSFFSPDPALLDNPEARNQVQACGGAAVEAAKATDIAPDIADITSRIIAKFAEVAPGASAAVTALVSGAVRCGIAIAQFEEKYGWRLDSDEMDPRTWTVLALIGDGLVAEAQRKVPDLQYDGLRLLSLFMGYVAQRSGIAALSHVLALPATPVCHFVANF